VAAVILGLLAVMVLPIVNLWTDQRLSVATVAELTSGRLALLY
jgi:hypothetical protein